MSVLLITYDLNSPGKNYDDLIEAFKVNPWARLSESCYAISTEKKPSQIYDELINHIDKNDNLFIMTLTNPYKGWGSNEVHKWLNNYL